MQIFSIGIVVHVVICIALHRYGPVSPVFRPPAVRQSYGLVPTAPAFLAQFGIDPLNLQHSQGN